jgi:hypothetical protein
MLDVLPIDEVGRCFAASLLYFGLIAESQEAREP